MAGINTASILTSNNFYICIPLNPINAIASNPAQIKAIGIPLNGAGIAEYSILSLIPASKTNASENPTATAKPFTTVSIKLYPSWILMMATPSTAQFVVIRGRKTPSALYSDGDVLAIAISTNWTNAAIIRIKAIVWRYPNPNGANKNDKQAK